MREFPLQSTLSLRLRQYKQFILLLLLERDHFLGFISLHSLLLIVGEGRTPRVELGEPGLGLLERKRDPSRNHHISVRCLELLNLAQGCGLLRVDRRLPQE